MGDRSNIVVQDCGDKAKRVWLYSHWGGEGSPAILRQALDRGRGRWEDAPYLARIIFCQMVEDDIAGTSGFGISTEMGDNERPILVCHCATQEVAIEDEDGNEQMRMTMEEFCKHGAPALTWEALSVKT